MKYLYFTAVKDQITDSIIKVAGREELVRRREMTDNVSLADILLNRTVQQKSLDTYGRIIQKSDPVLMEPGSRFGRAHFYAPFKRLGSLRISTLWFNMSVIWILNILLFLTLYFDLLKRGITQLEKLRIPGFGPDRLLTAWERKR